MTDNKLYNLPKKVHVIGICGVATSAIAIAFKNAGVIVTGSDKGFFPPVSTELEKHSISFHAGWHPEKMSEGGDPDVVIVGTASGSTNPETLYAIEKKIPIYSFAEAIGHYFAKENSIVCSGTWGKTSSTALTSFIFQYAGMNPTYMFGGISLSHDSSAKLTEAKISIFEGDEYKSSPTDTTAKFFYYKPTHLLLTAVSWDHADLYPTSKEYFDVFSKLIKQMENKGFIVACADNEGVLNTLNDYSGNKIFYGRKGNKNAKYTYSNVQETKNGLVLDIESQGEIWKINSPMLGIFQSENIAGSFAMAMEFGIKPKTIIEAIAQFKGLKRRLEKRYEGEITVIDDIAHSGEKAKSVLDTLARIYTGNIYAIFEPNSGGRQREAMEKYDEAFRSATSVIIPRLTKIKIGTDNESVEGRELSQIIARTHSNVSYIEDDKEVVKTLLSKCKKGDVICFLGSHGFRGMIEDVIEHLRSKM